jgi:hypothetical protein
MVHRCNTGKIYIYALQKLHHCSNNNYNITPIMFTVWIFLWELYLRLVCEATAATLVDAAAA